MFSPKAAALAMAFAAIATAAPKAEPVAQPETNVTLSERSVNQGFYLMDCFINGSRVHTWRQIAYYRDARHKSQHGEWPDALSEWFDYDALGASWVGSNRCAYGLYGDLTEACWNVEVNFPGGAYVGKPIGTGWTNNAHLHCWLDNGHGLYGADGWSCSKFAYCFYDN